MANSVNYLLHDSAVGYGIFEVVHQADSVGIRLNEVQDAMGDLAKFGKMVKLVNFSPWRLVLGCRNTEMQKCRKWNSS